jgi:peptidyl-prolyl cis-trans isomerase B (cyclophilin B)
MGRVAAADASRLASLLVARVRRVRVAPRASRSGRLGAGRSLLGVALACASLALAPPPAPAPAPAAAQEAVVQTAQGTFVIKLRPDLAPRHVAHFVKTAKAGGYDGTTFHRIIPGGIIQGGDPFSKDPARKAEYGRGGLGLLKAEFSAELPFTRGVVAAVRRPSSVDSAGNQFFIVLADQPSLKGQYTIYGEVAEGMDVVDAIGRTPVQGDQATTRVEIQKVTIRDPATP